MKLDALHFEPFKSTGEEANAEGLAVASHLQRGNVKKAPPIELYWGA